jgi:hypothetical protein
MLEKRDPLQQTVLGKLVTYMKKMKLEPYLSPCTKINSKWIKNINVRSATLKLLQENMEKTLEDTSIGNYFLTRTPIAQEIRARIDKWDYIKLKSFCTSTKTITRIKTQPTE